ncbi:MAG: calcium/sodium antiporter [Tistlia sp.]|uniref:calcium/sodium antiporter n=1 Tax=Tistlia sp. TaxID=3057121 RepID=UPI0034A1D1DE
MVYLEIAAGLVCLLAGGDALVRGAVALARRLGISPLLIGLVLVGFGTSTPELMTSLEAAFLGAPGIAIGNVVGSNTCNILLILGLGALLRPIAVAPAAFRRDGSVMALAALACLTLAFTGTLEPVIGLGFLLVLAVYLVFSYRQERTVGGASAELHRQEAASVPTAAIEPPSRLPLALLLAFGGLAGVLFGARLLVGGALEVAREAGLSETVLGLTLVAVGTSLPELAATLVAALRRQGDVALGNIVGSNIFNVFGILGVTAIVEPIPVPPQILAFDVWVMLAATAALIAAALLWRRLGRLLGLGFLAAYGAYLAVLFTQMA